MMEERNKSWREWRRTVSEGSVVDCGLWREIWGVVRAKKKLASRCGGCTHGCVGRAAVGTCDHGVIEH